MFRGHFGTLPLRGRPGWIAIAALIASGVAYAEKMDCSGSKKSKEEVERHTIKPGDRPDRELVQLVRVDIVKSKNPELDGTTMTVYDHLDHVGATGTHVGYGVHTLKSGEKVWLRFEGTHYITPNGDSWEIPYQGVTTIIAGTGKYKGIRGGGHYSGTVTPSGLREEFVCDAEY